MDPRLPARLAFGTMLRPCLGSEVRLLISSVRSFGARLGSAPFLVAYPEDEESELRPILDEAEAAGAIAVPYPLAPEAASFPLADKVPAAAAAEAAAARILVEGGSFVWMDADTLVLAEPTDLVLTGRERLAYRPVHHALIGSRIEEAPDAFWAAVYRACGVADPDAVVVDSTIDEQPLRFYPNAGLLAVRSDDGMLRSWAERFLDAYLRPEFLALYEEDRRRAVFVHQAFLSGTILAGLPREGLKELPFSYNYPLHLHGACPERLRPSTMERLTTLRYDSWEHRPGASGPSDDRPEATPGMGSVLAAWLEEHAG